MQPSASQGFRASLNLDVNNRACYVYCNREYKFGVGLVASFGRLPLHESCILAILDSKVAGKSQDSLGILVILAGHLNACVKCILALPKIYTGLGERVLGSFRSWTLMHRFPSNRHIELEMLVG